MSVFLPVAGISINLFLVVGAGMMVGLLSGLVGVGGGFLMTPILMMLGVPPTVAAASDTSAIVATSSSGVAAHFRLGNVDYKLGSILLCGGLVGAAIGVQLIKLLRALGNADFVITITYIVVLGSLGSFMVVKSVRSLRGEGMVPRERGPRRPQRPFLSRLPLQMAFPHSGIQHSVLVPFFLCLLVGMLAAIMGVGGGFIMVPMMVYLLHMPPHLAVGTDLFQILFTCAGVTFMQATTNHTVDLVLALLVALGSTIGAQIGARLTRRLRGEQLMIVLASLVLFVMAKMLVSILVTPSCILGRSKGEAFLRRPAWMQVLPAQQAYNAGVLIAAADGRQSRDRERAGARASPTLKLNGTAAPRKRPPADPAGRDGSVQDRVPHG